MQEFSLDALGVLMDLEIAGCELALADTKLRVASAGLTPALRRDIRQHRDELIGLVQLYELAPREELVSVDELKGSGLKRTASMTLKIAIFPPMPRASASTATEVKSGWRRKSRRP